MCSVCVGVVCVCGCTAYLLIDVVFDDDVERDGADDGQKAPAIADQERPHDVGLVSADFRILGVAQDTPLCSVACLHIYPGLAETVRECCHDEATSPAYRVHHVGTARVAPGRLAHDDHEEVERQRTRPQVLGNAHAYEQRGLHLTLYVIRRHVAVMCAGPQHTPYHHGIADDVAQRDVGQDLTRRRAHVAILQEEIENGKRAERRYDTGHDSEVRCPDLQVDGRQVGRSCRTRRRGVAWEFQQVHA